MSRSGIYSLLAGLWLALVASAAAQEWDPSLGYLGYSSELGDSGQPLVLDVVPESPAAKAGLRKGDVILAINGVRYENKPMSDEDAARVGENKLGGTTSLIIGRNGVEQEITYTLKSFLETYSGAAEQGDASAEAWMGRYYYYGAPSDRRDYAKAADWFRKAADQGRAVAQDYLGEMYRWGYGMPRDYVRALEWYRKAAEQQYADAENNVGEMYQFGYGVAKDDKVAASWYLKAASQGNSPAAQHLAYCYLKGRGVEQSDQKAFNWYYFASEQGESSAQVELAALYREGHGVKKENEEALKWYRLAAANGDHYAEWNLAEMYWEGLGVKVNKVESLKWYRKAQAGLPKNKELKAALGRVILDLFLDPKTSSKVDTTFLSKNFLPTILLIVGGLSAVYVLGGAVLFFFTLRVSEKGIRLPTSIGWILFFLESQFVAIGACLVVAMGGAMASLGALALFGALPVIASTGGALRRRMWGPSSASWRSLFFYGACAVAVILLIDLSYGKLYRLIFHSHLPEQPTIPFLREAASSSLFLALFVAGFLMPMAEEVIFRGFLFDSLRRRFSGVTVVIVTAFLFALCHFQFYYFLMLFGYGLVLGWAKLKTDSLRLPIVLHIVNNCLVLLIMR